jgi:hypothetical protein
MRYGAQALGRVAVGVCVFGSAVALKIDGCAAGGDDSADATSAQAEAVGMLRAVEGERLNLRSGVVDCECHYRTADRHVVREIRIVWEESRRRFDVKTTHGGTPEKTKIMFDGDRAVRFDGSHNADIADLPSQGGDLFFDPRELGLTTSYSSSLSLDYALGFGAVRLQDGGSIRLVGEDVIDGHRVRRVRVVQPNDWQLEFWVELGPVIRLWRTEYRAGLQVNVNTVEYGSGGVGAAFPTRVRTVYRIGEDRVAEREILVSRSQVNVPVAPKTWTLSGLDLPTGTIVTDGKLQRRMGYWNGAALADNVEMPAPDSSQSANPLYGRNRAFALLGINAIVLAGLLLVVWRTRRRNVQ